MSKRKSKQGSHGVYNLTCISHKCSRRFKVLYDVRTVSRAEQIEKLHPQANTSNLWGYVQFTYPFTGCPFCGAWWCTGPLDASAYPKKEKSVHISGPPMTTTERRTLIDALLRDQAKARGGTPQFKWLDDQGNELN